MESLVELFDDMKSKGIINNWAIGGGIAAKFYVNPPVTRDIDFFISIKNTGIMFMNAIYSYMEEHGAKFHSHFFKYKDMIVDIIPSPDTLVEEAIQQSIPTIYENVQVNMISPEYLAAIALSVGRKKDYQRVKMLQEAGLTDDATMVDICHRHKLLTQVKKYNHFLEDVR